MFLKKSICDALKLRLHLQRPIIRQEMTLQCTCECSKNPEKPPKFRQNEINPAQFQDRYKTSGHGLSDSELSTEMHIILPYTNHHCLYRQGENNGPYKQKRRTAKEDATHRIAHLQEQGQQVHNTEDHDLDSPPDGVLPEDHGRQRTEPDSRTIRRLGFLCPGRRRADRELELLTIQLSAAYRVQQRESVIGGQYIYVSPYH